MTQNSRVIGPLICSLRLVNRSGLQHDLGMCYLYGLGTKRDRKKGKALLTQAEENGYSE